MTRIIPVFVNSAKIELAVGSTALEAVRLWSEVAAQEVTNGGKIITDDRGLPILPDTTIHGGSIFRLVPARAAGAIAGGEIAVDATE